MPNRFIGLIDSGRIRDLAGLKRAFRQAAKKAHPDARASEPIPESPPGSAAFIALRRDYEEAFRYLAAPRDESATASAGTASGATQGADSGAATKPSGTAASAQTASQSMPTPLVHPWHRGSFYRGFEDLVARGFPNRPRHKGPGEAYDRSRIEVLAFLRGRDLIRPSNRLLVAFLEFEASYQALPSGGGFIGVENSGRRILYFFLSNVISYHRFGFRHVKRIARELGAEARDILISKGDHRVWERLSEARIQASGRHGQEKGGRSSIGSAAPDLDLSEDEPASFRFPRFLLEDLEEGPALED